jgi:hypothetical protein
MLEHGVEQRGLSVIVMGNDREISLVFFFHSSLSIRSSMGRCFRTERIESQPLECSA